MTAVNDSLHAADGRPKDRLPIEDSLPKGICREISEHLPEELDDLNKGIASMRLSTAMHDIAVEERRNNNNLRLHFDEPDDSQNFEKAIEDTARFFKVKHNDPLKQDDNLEHVDSAVVADPVVVLGVTLLGIHAARADENYGIVEKLLKLFNKKLGADFEPSDFPPIEAAWCFVECGKERSFLAQAELNAEHTVPTLNRFNKILAHTLEAVGTPIGQPDPKDALKTPSEILAMVTKPSDEMSNHIEDFTRIIVSLVDAIALLPLRYLSDSNNTEYSKWLKKTVKTVKVAQSNRQFPRLDHYLSLAEQVQGNLDVSKFHANNALQRAPAYDIYLVEQYRNHLLYIDHLIDMESKRTQFRKDLEKNFGEAEKNISCTVQSQQDGIQTQLNRQLESVRERLQKDIRESLLRVIEILGVFLAVVGVVATTIGGLNPDFLFWQHILVFGLGYMTIVSLFFVLEWIIHRRDGGKSEAEEKSESETAKPPVESG